MFNGHEVVPKIDCVSPIPHPNDVKEPRRLKELVEKHYLTSLEEEKIVDYRLFSFPGPGDPYKLYLYHVIRGRVNHKPTTAGEGEH